MDFDNIMDFILRPEIEGGYVDSSDDPGGETNFGISKRAHPDVDIKKLTNEKARVIYFEEYWLPSMAPALPSAMRLAYMDCAVNQGIERAAKLLQKILHVKVDGIVGPKTLFKSHKIWADTLLLKYLMARREHYMALSTFKRYGDGWMKRLFLVAMESELGEG